MIIEKKKQKNKKTREKTNFLKLKMKGTHVLRNGVILHLDGVKMNPDVLKQKNNLILKNKYEMENDKLFEYITQEKNRINKELAELEKKVGIILLIRNLQNYGMEIHMRMSLLKH